MNDGFNANSEARWQFRPFAWLMVSLRFLTRLPVPFVRTMDAPPLHHSMAMFPVAGALVGAVSAAALVLASMAGFAGILVVAYVYALKKGALSWKS